MYNPFIYKSKSIFHLENPITEDTAYEAVAAYLADATNNTEVVIHQKPVGNLWIYYYESAKYLRTQDDSQMLAGNAPILLDTTTGDAFLTGMTEPIEDYIAAYRQRNDPKISRMDTAHKKYK